MWRGEPGTRLALRLCAYGGFTQVVLLPSVGMEVQTRLILKTILKMITSASPLCSAALAARATLRRALLWWRDSAAEQAYLGSLRQLAAQHHRRTLLAAALAAWRLAAQRAQAMAALEQQRQQRLVAAAWHAWRLACQEAVLRRGLDAAAHLHRQNALQQQAFWAWRQRVADCSQVDLPPQHPTMQAAAALQRRRLLRGCLGAWRDYMHSCVLPRQAALQLRLLEQMMGSQRLAFVAWQQYCAHRQERRLAKVRSRIGWLCSAAWSTSVGCKRAAVHAAGSICQHLPSCMLILRRRLQGGTTCGLSWPAGGWRPQSAGTSGLLSCAARFRTSSSCCGAASERGAWLLGSRRTRRQALPWLSSTTAASCWLPAGRAGRSGQLCAAAWASAMPCACWPRPCKPGGPLPRWLSAGGLLSATGLCMRVLLWPASVCSCHAFTLKSTAPLKHNSLVLQPPLQAGG